MLIGRSAPRVYGRGHGAGDHRLLDLSVDGGHDVTRGFHTLAFHMTLRPGSLAFGASLERSPNGQVVAPAQSQQVNVKAWLMRRI